jgi:hypothetical protein
MSQELIVKNYNLDKKNRVAGVVTVSALTIVIVSMIATMWWPIVFLFAPALWASFGILVGGIESQAKCTYFRDIAAERNSDIKRHKEQYPSLYEGDRENWLNKTGPFRQLDVAKAMLTGKPLTYAFKSKETDEFGGSIQGGVEIKGFTMTVQEKRINSDIQMWKEAYENAKNLK